MSIKEPKECLCILPTPWISPELSNFSSRKVLVSERFEPLRAGDFALRTTSVSPLDHAKGRMALDPGKNALHSSVTGSCQSSMSFKQYNIVRLSPLIFLIFSRFYAIFGDRQFRYYADIAEKGGEKCSGMRFCMLF